MATLVVTDGFFSYGGTDLSDWVKTIRVNYESETQDETAMGDTTRIFKGGLKSWSMDIEMMQDEAASAPAQTLFSAVGATGTVIVRPASSSVSSTNPNYTGTGLVASFPPFGATVGELNMTSLRIVSAGDLSRATS